MYEALLGQKVSERSEITEFLLFCCLSDGNSDHTNTKVVARCTPRTLSTPAFGLSPSAGTHSTRDTPTKIDGQSERHLRNC